MTAFQFIDNEYDKFLNKKVVLFSPEYLTIHDVKIVDITQHRLRIETEGSQKILGVKKSDVVIFVFKNEKDRQKLEQLKEELIIAKLKMRRFIENKRATVK